ncbi:MAG: pseudaminic acid synthase [Candidatus Margulisiibacteriota bacterium]
MRNINIGRRRIGPDQPPFIIAEMSGNHNHSLARALAIVDAAAKAGAHALKIQTYTAETMTLDLTGGAFSIRDKKSLWRGKSLFDLYRQAATPWEWHKPIFDRCRKLGMIGFSSPFDATAVAFLEKLKVPCYKIASFELVDLPLIKKAAATGKPLIMSTGLATEREIAEAVGAARKAGNNKIVLLKCTSTYPASPENSNLLTIPDLQKRFGCQVGLSDHTLGIGAALAGVVLGAVVVEKHFTLARADGGVDAAFSLEPAELKALVAETERARLSLGAVKYGSTAAEKGSLKFRRSLYIVKDLQAGEKLSPENMRAIRPGLGLPPKYYDKLIGKKLKKAVKRGTPVSWGIIR